MQTRLSTKGQIVIPGPMRRRLGIRAGDTLDASVEDGRIVLTPARPPKLQARIVKNPILGTPALSFGPEAPILTSKQVEEILSDFP